MATWSFNGGGLKVAITYTIGTMVYDTPDVVELLASIRAMHIVVSLTQMKFLPAAPPTYRYTWKAVDGRTWDQQLIFAPEPADPGMVFTHTDVWRESEFAPHRRVRTTIQRLVKTYGMTHLMVDF